MGDARRAGLGASFPRRTHVLDMHVGGSSALRAGRKQQDLVQPPRDADEDTEAQGRPGWEYGQASRSLCHRQLRLLTPGAVSRWQNIPTVSCLCGNTASAALLRFLTSMARFSAEICTCPLDLPCQRTDAWLHKSLRFHCLEGRDLRPGCQQGGFRLRPFSSTCGWPSSPPCILTWPPLRASLHPDLFF